jgi:hypothetical protein
LKAGITTKEVAKEEIRSAITVTEPPSKGLRTHRENEKMLIVEVIALENYSRRLRNKGYGSRAQKTSNSLVKRIRFESTRCRSLLLVLTLACMKLRLEPKKRRRKIANPFP